MDSINFSESAQLNELTKKYSPYISELRKRFFFTIILFLIASISGFIFYEKIIKLLIDILSLKGINIVFTSPFQFINLAISCGLASGLVIIFPLIAFQILSFLKPALRPKEFKMIITSLPFSIILFLIGFSFGILVMRWQIQIFLATSLSLEIGNILDISRLLGTVLITAIFMGIGFQLPVVLLILLRIGIVKPAQISKHRLWVYLGTFLLTFLLPADSIITDLILALPFIIMFEITLLLNRLFSKKGND